MQPTDPTERIDPAEPIDRIDPLEPMDRIDPLEPMDRIDPLEPLASIEPAEPAWRDERIAVGIAPFSHPRQRPTPDPRPTSPGRRPLTPAPPGRPECR
jgi:hypothetical protein